jgi:hypothetical protein
MQHSSHHGEFLSLGATLALVSEAEGRKPTISACGLTCSATERVDRLHELIRAFVPRYATGDPIPDVEVFEDRLAEALPDGVSTRDCPA